MSTTTEAPQDLSEAPEVPTYSEDLSKPPKTYMCTRSLPVWYFFESNLSVFWRSLLVCSQSCPAVVLQKSVPSTYFL